MDSRIRYRNLWNMLRRRGFNCGMLSEGNHRICTHPESGARVTLYDYPADDFVHPELLFGVRLNLANFGVMTREEFDRWIWRRSLANEAKENGSTRQSADRKSGNGAARTKRSPA